MSEVLWVREGVDEGPESPVKHGEPDVEQGRPAAEDHFPSSGIGERQPPLRQRMELDAPVSVRDEVPGLGVVERGRRNGRAGQKGGGVTGACADDGHERCRPFLSFLAPQPPVFKN
ncbi:hypothetical protein, partial [Streptomyces sp. ID05-47C]|uniref:hypothetical protein n=1 Tax=Streptomyces sp. ID05-47C TaxID=3028665 RepID=UPI0029AFFF66